MSSDHLKQRTKRLLVNGALTQPAFVWEPPGIGKSALGKPFAHGVSPDFPPRDAVKV